MENLEQKLKEKGIYFNRFNAENKTLANAYIIVRDEDGNLSLVIKSSHMVWNEDRWTTDSAEVYRFDEKNIDIIYSESFDESELGMAIMNRLVKAAGYNIVKL